MSLLHRLIYIAIAFFSIIDGLNAQDAHFSQFYANPVYLNPALVGTADGNRVVFNHRQQWSKPIKYTTSAVSIDGKLNTNKTGWGVQVLNDNQINGMLVQTKATATLAHRIEIKKHQYLGLGLGVGVYQKKVNWSDLVFEDQIDPRHGAINPTNERFGKEKIANATVSVGVLYLSENLFGGISASNVNRPLENFTNDVNERLAIKYTAHFGAVIDMNQPGQKQFVSPNIIFEKQGPISYVNFGFYYGIENISVGLYYRTDDALIGLFGLNYSNFKMGYSYDYTISNVATGDNNSHEISFAYLFELPKKYNKKGRYKGQCPKFYKYLL
ncbi:MAG: PorP/SprF family type IX secretion system membrane protein [Cyclobacteriaceae bacterium]|nr:PorP/SprF family type IX secretion system membrane protein [Cyclobacteriaceae bacterium]